MILLKTKRLTIRDPLATDISGWHKLLSNREAMYYLQDIMTTTHEESRVNLDAAIAEADNPNRIKYFFAMENIQTGEFIGTVGSTVLRITPVGKIVDLGYFILPEHQGLGYMTEAVPEVVRFAFEDINAIRINTGCITENIASERVMQKCGFTKEGEFKCYTWHDGRMKDRVVYRMLRDAWKNR